MLTPAAKEKIQELMQEISIEGVHLKTFKVAEEKRDSSSLRIQMRLGAAATTPTSAPERQQMQDPEDNGVGFVTRVEDDDDEEIQPSVRTPLLGGKKKKEDVVLSAINVRDSYQAPDLRKPKGKYGAI